MKKIEAFKRDYQKLLEKHGVSVVGVPKFMARQDGAWAVVVSLEVYENEKKGEKKK